MKSLLLLYVFAVYQLAVAVAVNIAPVIIDGDTPNSCPSQGKLEKASEILRNSTRAAISKLTPQCGDGMWDRLISINMSSADSQCPDGWVEENEGGVRACGRGTVDASCQSVFLKSNNLQIEYSRVCGRAIGYQYGHPDAFSQRSSGVTIDQNYVDGLSLTYGSPHQHLWTFAAGAREFEAYNQIYNCPCSIYPGASPPLYLGNNWYCESGNMIDPTYVHVYSSDPLWDGENCEGTCCGNGKSPPWFSVELPAPTGDYIEARICANEHSDRSEDVYINIFEIYIQ